MRRKLLKRIERARRSSFCLSLAMWMNSAVPLPMVVAQNRITRRWRALEALLGGRRE